MAKGGGKQNARPHAPKPVGPRSSGSVRTDDRQLTDECRLEAGNPQRTTSVHSGEAAWRAQPRHNSQHLMRLAFRAALGAPGLSSSGVPCTLHVQRAARQSWLLPTLQLTHGHHKQAFAQLPTNRGSEAAHRVTVGAQRGSAGAQSGSGQLSAHAYGKLRQSTAELSGGWRLAWRASGSA